jgi:hypothetical protein
LGKCTWETKIDVKARLNIILYIIIKLNTWYVCKYYLNNIWIHTWTLLVIINSYVILKQNGKPKQASLLDPQAILP